MPISWLTVLKAVPWGDVISNAPVVVDGARKLWNNVGRKGDTAPGPAQPTAAATDTCAAPTDTATALAQLRARRAKIRHVQPPHRHAYDHGRPEVRPPGGGPARLRGPGMAAKP